MNPSSLPTRDPNPPWRGESTYPAPCPNCDREIDEDNPREDAACRGCGNMDIPVYEFGTRVLVCDRTPGVIVCRHDGAFAWAALPAKEKRYTYSVRFENGDVAIGVVLGDLEVRE